MQGKETKANLIGHSFADEYPGEGGAEKGALVWNRLKTGEQVTDFAMLGNTPLRFEFIPILDKNKEL